MEKLATAFSMVADQAERYNMDVALSMMPWNYTNTTGNFRRVVDSGRFLDAGPCCVEVPAAEARGTTDLGVCFQNHDTGARVGGRDRRGQAGGPGTDDCNIVVVAHRWTALKSSAIGAT